MPTHLIRYVRIIVTLGETAVALLYGVTAALGQPTLKFTQYPAASTERPAITTGPDGALWFTERVGRIGRITTSGILSEFDVPLGLGKEPFGIAAGSDGALWFTELSGASIGRITVDGAISEFPLPSDDRMPFNITAGPDGALWFTEWELDGPGRIGRITTEGVLTEYECGESCKFPHGIAAGPDGALWFTETSHNSVWRVTTTGVFTKFDPFVTQVADIIPGTGGVLWFGGGDTAGPCDNIGRISTTGSMTAFPLPIYPRPGFNLYNNLYPSRLAFGRDDAVWFTASRVNVVGRLSAGGAVTLYPLPGALREHWLERGITRGPDGALWISDETGIVRAALSGLKGGVQIDVRPAVWRNIISVSATGNLPVAILGTATFDVRHIDVSTVRLEGVRAVSGTVQDVAAAGEGLCGPGDADGHPDLKVMFDLPTLLKALRPLPAASEVRVLRLTARLKPEFGEQRIHGQDVVVLRVP